MGRDPVAPDPAWLAKFVADQALGTDFAASLDRVHAPLAAHVAEASRAADSKPHVIGLCGPQGSGKTTAVALLAHLLGQQGLRVASLSIDDLYLTRSGRRTLAAKVHPLLATRGVPGTHDVALGVATIAALGGPSRVALPLFDKAIDDRLAEDRWPMIDAPVDIVLFEGWCVGARPEDPADLVEPVNQLEAEEDADGRWRRYVDDQLAGPYQALFARIDLLILLTAPDFATVVRWRAEQEDKLRARRGAGGAVMDDAALARFMQHYERLTRHIADEMPARADVVIALDADRQPITIKGLAI
jgi:D-glycerate 3-kinase